VRNGFDDHGAGVRADCSDMIVITSWIAGVIRWLCMVAAGASLLVKSGRQGRPRRMFGFGADANIHTSASATLEVDVALPVV
jgi:hypothetical protein